jgi:hypothetical protein
LRVGDEMDLVARGGKFNAELGGDHAGAAIGGVTRDADTHAGALHFSECEVTNQVMRALLKFDALGFKEDAKPAISVIFSLQLSPGSGD